MSENESPIARKLRESQAILELLDFPRAQLNDRSALTLLALLNLKPDKAWKDAEAPLMGITPIMDWCRGNYDRTYAPNTRETFRRQTMHQFIAAGLVVTNPDKLDRSINSPKWCYQIEPRALALLRQFGTPDWDLQLQDYKAERVGLRRHYAQERDLKRLPVLIDRGKQITLSPGDHSQLIRQIIEEFGPRFVPGATLVYVGDTGDKWGYFDELLLQQLGVEVDAHGKMPDVVLYMPEKNWLLLIESVTSHGPVDGKRHDELAQLFKRSSAGLVYVTAFPSRTVMARYLQSISWESEVWIADNPDHLIHFDGERFLGPYGEQDH